MFPRTSSNRPKREFFLTFVTTTVISGAFHCIPLMRRSRNSGWTPLSRLVQYGLISQNIDDEWASKTEWHRVCVFRPRLAEYVATTIKKGAHLWRARDK